MHLHVGNILGILGLFRVHGEQVLATRLLPFVKGSAFKRGNAHFTQVLALFGVFFLFLHFAPLFLGHAAGYSNPNKRGAGE